MGELDGRYGTRTTVERCSCSLLRSSSPISLRRLAQIIRRFLDHDSPAPGRAVFAVKGRPSFAPQESLDALDPQGCTTAVDHRLEYLPHSSSALKQQVAAIFGLIDRVLVVKFAPLLGQGVCDLSQAGGVGDA